VALVIIGPFSQTVVYEQENAERSKKSPDGMVSMKLVLVSGQWRVDELAFQL